MSVAFRPGDRVVYEHRSRGGYGFVVRRVATVVHVTDKRVTIAIDPQPNQGSIVSVRPTSLTPCAASPTVARRLAGTPTAQDTPEYWEGLARDERAFARDYWATAESRSTRIANAEAYEARARELRAGGAA